MENLILASSSSIYGSGFLEYLQPELNIFFKGVTEILFIPYARPSGISFDGYTEIVADSFRYLNITVKGIHSFNDRSKAIENAQAIFVGGGNTFVLVATLQKLGLMDTLKKTIEEGTRYLGTSAGSNICGESMQTTNDMPIMMPKSFETLNVIPFNLNAHFIKADKNSTHKGETRETRIQEFHVFNDTPVIGLSEGSWLRVNGDNIVLQGVLNAVLFEKNEEAIVFKPNEIFKV